MKTRRMIEKCVGPRNAEALLAQVKYALSAVRGQKGDLWVDPQAAELAARIHEDGQHIFFGYYDLRQVSRDGTMLLAHRVRRGASTARDPVEIGLVRLPEGTFQPLATSRAWCWQQGARLRWHPLTDDKILFNDVEDDRFVTRVFDRKAQTFERTIPRALYDLSPDFQWGVSLNFARLQRLRPGYGYDSLPDDSRGRIAPEDDGLFLTDLADGEARLAMPLARLAEDSRAESGAEHYLNHVSIASDGRKFLFFHLWTSAAGSWRVRLCVSDSEVRTINVLDAENKTSHYAWVDANRLLTTEYSPDGAARYALYDLSDGRKTILDRDCLRQDGHPVCLGDGSGFLTDTYPDHSCMQRVILVPWQGVPLPVARAYSDPRLYGEMRCDLHPRLDWKTGLVVFDSTVNSKVRGMVALKLK